jgi:hypothetical protein
MTTLNKSNLKQNLIDYEFWLWEYQRRNELYASDTKEIIAEALKNYHDLRNNSLPSSVLPTSLAGNPQQSCFAASPAGLSDKSNVAVTINMPTSTIEFPQKTFQIFIHCANSKSIREFIAKHKRFPRQISNGYPGESLIKTCVIEDRKLAFDIKDFHVPQLVSTFECDENSKMCKMAFPATCDPDLVAKEAKYFLAYESDKELDQLGFVKSQQYFIELIEFWVRSKANKRLTVKNQPRAIGIWLWEKQIREGLSQAKTIKAFDEQFGESEVTTRCKQFLEEANIRKILIKTIDCIRTAQVLPLS